MTLQTPCDNFAFCDKLGISGKSCAPHLLTGHLGSMHAILMYAPWCSTCGRWLYCPGHHCHNVEMTCHLAGCVNGPNSNHATRPCPTMRRHVMNARTCSGVALMSCVTRVSTAGEALRLHVQCPPRAVALFIRQHQPRHQTLSRMMHAVHVMWMVYSIIRAFSVATSPQLRKHTHLCVHFAGQPSSI